MFNFLRCRNFHTDSHSCRVTQMQKLKKLLLVTITLPLWLPVMIWLFLLFTMLDWEVDPVNHQNHEDGDNDNEM